MKTYYIYALIDPRSNEIRYIGQTIDPKRRLSRHLCPYYYNDGTHKGNWIRQLIELNLTPRMEILKTVSEDEWQKSEIETIQEYRKLYRLTNIDDGGSGGTGRKFSQESKDKLSASITSHWKSITKDEYRKRITRDEDKASKFFGVSSHKNGTWRAYITLNGKSKFRNAKTELDAARIRDEMVREFYPPARWVFNLS